MIEPVEFYDKSDSPDRAAKQRMWRAIKNEIHRPNLRVRFITDKKSFIWGMAASVVIYFTSVGIYTTAKQSMINSQPQVVRLDAAYQSAIQEFEKVVPQVVSTGGTDPNTLKYFSARKEELANIDNAIIGLKSESAGTDISPIKQKKLRELYGLKLKVLQEMVENGEIEL